MDSKHLHSSTEKLHNFTNKIYIFLYNSLKTRYQKWSQPKSISISRFLSGTAVSNLCIQIQHNCRRLCYSFLIFRFYGVSLRTTNICCLNIYINSSCKVFPWISWQNHKIRIFSRRQWTNIFIKKTCMSSWNGVPAREK